MTIQLVLDPTHTLQRTIALLEEVVDLPADPHNPHDRGEMMRTEALTLIGRLHELMETAHYWQDDD